MGKASHFILKNPMQKFLPHHCFTNNGTEVHRDVAKVTWLRNGRSSHFNSTGPLNKEPAFLTTHFTTSSNKKKIRRPSRASKDMCSDIILIHDLGQEISLYSVNIYQACIFCVPDTEFWVRY